MFSRELQKRATLLVVCFSLTTMTLDAQEKIGETVYLDGEVSITRNGNALDSSQVIIGVPIDNFDLMETGDDGNAQVRITTTKAANGSTITLSPDTQFTFELTQLQGRQTSSINLISGSLSLKVSKLSGSQDLEVQTETTVLGVRGTQFDVSTSDAGDVLVTCNEGAVSCRTSSGTEYRAVPGTVVENQEGGAFRAIPVPVTDLESFRRTWVEQRRAAVRANAAGLIQSNAERYLQLRSAYDRDYTALMRQRNIISKWTTEDRRGGIGAAEQVDQEKRAIAATMMRLRATQFTLERVQARLLRLKRLHDQGLGRGTLPGGVSTENFFSELQRDHNVVNSHMATVRNVARLYTLRNGGQDPSSHSQMFRQRQLRQERLRAGPVLSKPSTRTKVPIRPEKRPQEQLLKKKKIPGENEQQ